jgi:hypothetical protein
MSNTDLATDLAAPQGAWVEILRGRTRFPRRPVRGDRFLIGGGSQCDLQLGGDDVPMLHSLIVVEGAEATIEAVSPTPVLLLNGEPARTATLRHGDRVEVGKVAFQFHHDVVRTVTTPAITQEQTFHLPAADTTAPAFDELPAAVPSFWQPELDGMTVEQLINRIEAEEAQADDFESRRHAGALALLDAVRHAQPAEEPSELETVPALRLATPETDATEIATIAPVAETTHHLEQLAADLAERERQLLEYEAALAAQAAELAAVQDRLSGQIEQFRQHLRPPELDQPSEVIRLSA